MFNTDITSVNLKPLRMGDLLPCVLLFFELFCVFVWLLQTDRPRHGVKLEHTWRLQAPIKVHTYRWRLPQSRICGASNEHT